MQPYYVIDFSASACMFEIRINDYPVIVMDVSGQVSSMVPINFAILEKGKQQISARILPVSGRTELAKEVELKFSIKLFDVTQDFVFKDQFGDYQSKSVEDKKLPIINYENTFLADVPYRLQAWQNGKNLKDVKECREKLEKAYHKLITVLENSKFDIYQKLIEKREKNMTESMYLSKEEADARMKGLIREFASGMKIRPLADDAIMFFYADNRVTALKRPNGDSALSLVNEEKREELMLDVSFFIPEGKDEFEII